MTNLLTNMIVLGLSQEIPTNTPAWQAYAFHAMFTNAQHISSCWKLNGEKPFTTNMVTFFEAKPNPIGVQGGISFNNQHVFAYRYGRFSYSGNKLYGSHVILSDDVEKNDLEMQKWLRATNLLTFKKARKIAENAFLSLGFTPNKTGFKEPYDAREWHYEKGKPLPLYSFGWKSEYAAISVEVSGIISNVVYFANSSPELKLAQPTNYLEMLGLPTNTVFVRRRPQPAPLPPRFEVYQP